MGTSEENTSLLHEDLLWCLRRLPKKVFNLMKEEHDKIMLAGGYIRSCISNEQQTDIDLFCKTKDSAEIYARRLVKEGQRLISTDNAFTIIGKKPVIQFIHRWVYNNPADILPSFDFTIARAVIWFDGDNWQSLCDGRYYADLAAKRLVYCSPVRIEEVGGSTLRVLKFYQRGYRIPLDSLAGTIARVMTGIDFEKASDEESWKHIITGLLREVDPDIDMTHISHLPAQKKGDPHD